MEEIILSNLAYNEKYARKIVPYLSDELFSYDAQKKTYQMIREYLERYNALPTKEVLYINLENTNDISEQMFNDTKEIIGNLKVDEDTKFDWLIDETEKFVQDRTITNAIRRSIRILDADTDLTKSAIPGLLQEALSVSFNTEIGHDFIADAETRYEIYHQKDKKLRFNLDYFNRITGGGLPTKTLSCIMASTGVGKSLAMCSMAAANLMDQQNVLYITLEMAEERIAERIDANLMDTPVDGLIDLTKTEYVKKMEAVSESTKGRFIIKEYPTASASAEHFRNLLDELKIKKNFVPDVVYVDYINLCMSSRIKIGAGANSYAYIKAIAEELRGLAVEYEIPIITATQANRDAIGSSDVSLTNTSDSIGLPMTVDFMVAIIATEELDEENKFMVKQLKNRFGDPGKYRRFFVGVDKSKMRLYDCANEIQEEAPVMDNGDFNTQNYEPTKFGGFT